MGDKRRYRATEGVLRRQRGIQGLYRCAKRPLTPLSALNILLVQRFFVAIEGLSVTL